MSSLRASVVMVGFVVASLGGCEAISRQARLDAIGHMMRGDYASASRALRRCEREVREDELYHCLALRADIALRRADYGAAEKDYRASLTLRARIAKAEGYGRVSAHSLFSWAFAASWIHAPDARALSRRALAAARRHHKSYGDGHLLLAAARWLVNRNSSPSRQRELVPHACNQRERRYYRSNTGHYFPDPVWRALARACERPTRSHQAP